MAGSRFTDTTRLKMKFPPDVRVYGDQSYRGNCPSETLEQVTFFNRLRTWYGDSWGLVALHPRNEGVRHFRQVAREKAEGMTKGASDVIIAGSPTFVCEIKRRDHTKSQWQDGQQEFLNAAKKTGSFVCIALGADAAWEAFADYLAEWEAQRPNHERDGGKGPTGGTR